MTRHRRPTTSALLLGCVLLLPASLCVPDTTDSQGTARLQELLYGEALFHSHQQDYLSAISRLQLAEAQGLLPRSSEEARILLARLKLAYGMHLEAGFDLHALLGDDVPPTVRNRAWCELARAFSHKGYHEAAAESLDNIQGQMPDDIVGDCQLLRATVLMSLNRNREAAQVLEQWQGAPELAAYAHYNRGIALVRAGDYPQVVPSLEKAVKMPAQGEELQALRDKARLALGYAFAREEDYKRARKQLAAVRQEGPFSNRALLALGWIAYKQGHRESALTPWTKLRNRAPTDPAVLETLLVVPAVHRELDALQLATRDYEAAVAAYNDELDQLDDARNSVQKGEIVAQLLRSDEASGQSANSNANHETLRFLGALLASRNFAEMQQDHSELQAMLDNVDRGLQDLQSLPTGRTQTEQAAPLPGSAAPGSTVAPESPLSPEKRKPGEPNTARWQHDWVHREGEQINQPTPGIPQLPEIESPSRRSVKPFPKRELPSAPPVSNYIKQPPSPEIFGLAESEILELPESGEFFKRPDSGEFFRRPGEEEIEDYAYPDQLPNRGSKKGKDYAYQVSRLLPVDEEKTGFDVGAVPVGEALRQLAAALNSATQRMVELNGSYDAGTEMEQSIIALRERILTLRSRIANAISLYENYTRALALDELDGRQALLEDLLEQASLELAKTYDRQSTQ